MMVWFLTLVSSGGVMRCWWVARALRRIGLIDLLRLFGMVTWSCGYPCWCEVLVVFVWFCCVGEEQSWGENRDVAGHAAAGPKQASS